MRSVVVVAVLFAATSALCLDTADAAGRGRIRLFARSFEPANPVAFGAPTFPNDYGTRYRSPSVEELYPKYYGGFHYRHLDNIGIPSGDIGLRGNGLYMSPW